MSNTLFDIHKYDNLSISNNSFNGSNYSFNFNNQQNNTSSFNGSNYSFNLDNNSNSNSNSYFSGKSFTTKSNTLPQYNSVTTFDDKGDVKFSLELDKSLDASKSLTDSLNKQLSPKASKTPDTPKNPVEYTTDIPKKTKFADSKAGKTMSGISKTVGSIASALPSLSKPINTNDAAQSSFAQATGQVMLSIPNPFVQAAGATLMLSDKLGLNGDASKNASTAANVGNFLMGLIPGSKAFASKASEIDINQRVASSSGYAGTANLAKKAKEDSGGHFVFGTGTINKFIEKAALAQERASANLEKSDLAHSAARNPLIGIRNRMQMSGGYNPLVAKQGSKLYNLKQVQDLISQKKLTKKYQEGGELILSRSLEDLGKQADAQNPKFWNRTNLQPWFTTWEKDGNLWAGSHELNWDLINDDEAIVFPTIQDFDGKLIKFDNWQEAKDSAIRNNDYLIMTPEEAVLFTDNYEQLKPDFFQDYNKEYNDFITSLPQNQLYTPRSAYDTRTMWELSGQPSNFEEAVQQGLYVLEPDGWHANSVVMDPKTGNYHWLKSVDHPTHWMEEKFYQGLRPVLKEGSLPESTDINDYYFVPLEGEDAKASENIRSNYDIDKSGKYWKYILKDGVEFFKKGGSFNVIPSGALHKNKHHLEDIDDKFKEVTNKGIPVVTEEDGKIVQHAEVEKEEIILRFEVTKKLEQLAKENTDEAAIEAGKILTDEILNNTIDKTNNLL